MPFRYFLNDALQTCAGVIVADNADEHAFRAEARDIARDVAGAADHDLLALHRDDRRRRLGRNARHLAIDEIIKHQVADAEHGELSGFLQLFFEIEHGCAIYR